MIRELFTFTSPDELAAYLLIETGEPAEFVTETIAIATKDGIVVLDNGKAFGLRAWEITYANGTFQVRYESGNLNAEGEII